MCRIGDEEFDAVSTQGATAPMRRIRHGVLGVSARALDHGGESEQEPQTMAAGIRAEPYRHPHSDAKSAYSHACRAYLDRDPAAPELVAAALARLQAAAGSTEGAPC